MGNVMQYYELAPGLKIPRIITGLWQIADMEKNGANLDLDETAKAMLPYVKVGFSAFDMADHYGSAEEVSGIFQNKYNPGLLANFFTKWVPSPPQARKEEVRNAITRSLTRLQTDHLDLLQFHAWNYADSNWLDCLFWLKELQDEGLIKHLGVTNFDTTHLRIAIKSGIKLVSNQVCYSLLDQRPVNAMNEFCLNNGVKLLAYGTIAGGLLTDTWIGKPEPLLDDLPGWSQMKYKRFIDNAGGWEKFQLLLKSLDNISKNLNVSVANVASKYILDQPSVGSIIIGAHLGRSEHIDNNLQLMDLTLDESSKSEIKEALANLNPIPGDCGDEYRRPPYLTASGDLSHHLETIPPPYAVQNGLQGISKVLSGTIWEDMAGFSRAIRKGNRILVSGTTATNGDQAIGGDDPVAQTHFVIDKIEGALQSLGGKLEDVIRTRVYIKNVSDWEVIAKVHGERFRNIQPANTLVKAEIIGDQYLVEIEAEAEVP